MQRANGSGPPKRRSAAIHANRRVPRQDPQRRPGRAWPRTRPRSASSARGRPCRAACSARSRRAALGRWAMGTTFDFARPSDVDEAADRRTRRPGRRGSRPGRCARDRCGDGVHDGSLLSAVRSDAVGGGWSAVGSSAVGIGLGRRMGATAAGRGAAERGFSVRPRSTSVGERGRR